MKLLLRNCLLRNKIVFRIVKPEQFLLFWLLSCLGKLDAQQIANYVNNGSFESLNSNTVSSYYNAANYWQPIDTNKYSYYLYSTFPQIATAPNCSQGFQTPRTGHNFIAPTFFCSTCPNTNSRGYPRNRLKKNLTAGKTYCTKYYIVNTNNSPLAIDSYGIYFANSTLDTIKYCTMPLSYLMPQVQNPNGIITDTLNWIAITGTFVANGTEKYMVLGNFKTDIATNTLLINPTFSATLVNDIYIDDVSCIDIDLPAFAGHDTTCIPGSSVYIGRPRDIGIDEDCRWYKLPNTTTAIDTAAGIWVNPISTSTYMVRQEICGLVKWDTVVIYEDHVGLEKLDLIANELNIFPVPAGDYVELRIANEEWMKDFDKVSILNSLGLKIREEEIHFENKSVKIKTNDLPEGVYSIVISNTQNETVTKKLLITK